MVKGPEGIDLSANGELWVAGRTPEGGITVIDAATDTVKRTIQTKTKMANRVKFTRDGARVLVSDPPSNAILVFDAVTKELIKTIATAAGPEGMLLTADGKRLFVACSAAGKVQAYDTTTWTVTAEAEPGNDPDGMAYAAAAKPAPATTHRP